MKYKTLKEVKCPLCNAKMRIDITPDESGGREANGVCMENDCICGINIQFGWYGKGITKYNMIKDIYPVPI